MRFRVVEISLFAIALLGCSATWGIDSVSPEEVRFFESQVRPVLAANCVKCHGLKKQRGGLRLDSREAILQGGESGTSVVPGDPEQSLLISAIRHDSLQMPPDEKLSESDVEALTAWVRRGAPWPADAGKIVVVVDRRERILSESDRQYWAFQPLRNPSSPAAVGSAFEHSPLDRFVSARRAEEGLVAAPPAAPRALVRRAFYDLLGLPPTLAELDAFEASELPDRYERLLDELQASPRYGEKWGRHWLDLVRYAESDGYKQDDYRPHAWRYRDYVVRSLNTDKSYRQFLQEQIAGDELDPTNLEAQVATGYLRHWTYEYNQRDVRGQWTNVLNDITDVTADVFLGLGMSCARCHDHKYDPLLQRDYFRLQAFFAPLQPRDEMVVSAPEVLTAYQQRLAHWNARTAEIRDRLTAIEKPHRHKVAQSAIEKFPKDIRPMLAKSDSERTPLEQQLATFAYRQVSLEQVNLKMDSKLSEPEKSEWLELTKRLAEFDADRPVPPGQAQVVSDVGISAPPTWIPGRPGALINPGFPSVLDPSDAEIVPTATTTGRRSALASWLASDQNPLTARVLVNRIWQFHFGRGLVRTASDFGRLGEPPTHPELLDWLTHRFQLSDWKLKPLHRLLMTSATYCQAARVHSPAALERDPDNRWLWHMPVRRLQAEQLRDAVLVASGEIDFAIGGPGVDASIPRRTLYTKVLRNRRDSLLEAFDGADSFSSTAERNVTTTPTQALILINGPFALARASQLATETRSIPDDHELVVRLYSRILFRAPASEELSLILPLLAAAPDRDVAIEDIAHVLLNASEFLYVE